MREVEIHLRLSQPERISDFSNIHVFVGDVDFNGLTTGVFHNGQNAECGAGQLDPEGRAGKYVVFRCDTPLDGAFLQVQRQYSAAAAFTSFAVREIRVKRYQRADNVGKKEYFWSKYLCTYFASYMALFAKLNLI